MSYIASKETRLSNESLQNARMDLIGLLYLRHFNNFREQQPERKTTFLNIRTIKHSESLHVK